MGICFSEEGTANGTRSGDGNQGGVGNMLMGMLIKKGKEVITAKMRKNGMPFTREVPPQEYHEKAEKVIPAEIHVFSGCQDDQTSADVNDVTSFGLPIPDPANKAGGACTNSMLYSLKNKPQQTYGELLLNMRAVLKQRRYTQIPQLTASRNCELQKKTFSVYNEKKNGRTRALLIGINYIGHNPGQLSGCINDVKMMRDYLISQGYSSDPSNMMIITEEMSTKPNGAEMIRGIKWLCEGAQAGDSLFFHYSGHGTQQKDTNGDELDGMDECIVPLDFKQNGLIDDDTLFQLICGSLPKDVNLVCLFDCCNSGTVLDLPFIFTVNGEAASAIQVGEPLQMQANQGFSFAFAQQLLSQVAKGIFNSLLKGNNNAGGKVNNNNNNNPIFAELMKIGQNFMKK